MVFTRSLQKNYQFRYVYNRGKSFANKYLVMYVIKNAKNININRLGISVSKKVGKSVVRSRVTRLIRESFRLSEKNIRLGYDIVIIARAGTKGVPYKEIDSSVKYLLKKHGLV